MKRIFFILVTAIFGLSCYGQTDVEYEVTYNSSTGLYEARAHVVAGQVLANVPPFTTLGSSTYTIVLPESVANTPLVATTVDAPGTAWTNADNIYSSDPNGVAGVDYRTFITGGGGVFPTFQAGDEYILFTFSLGGNCVGGVRVFNNGSLASGGDGNSTELGGSDLSNSLQFVTGEQYVGNQNNTGTACIFIQDTTGPWDVASNWVDNAVPTVNDDAIIAADVISTVRQDQQVKSLVLEQGTTGVTTVTIDDGFQVNIKENVTNNGEFTGDGEVLLDGAGNQDMFGVGDYENLRINNLNGVDVENTDLTDPTTINGVVTVDAGNFSTNDNVLLPCTFAEPTAGNFENGRNAQVGPLGGTITGDMMVEQCYPGRRAFRLVASSVTTDNSIQDNWQENASSYTDVPVANATQADGIEYGFGTHITGLGFLPAHAYDNPSTTDQIGGLDWQASGNPSMYSFDETTQAWNAIEETENSTNASAPNLVAGEPYMMMIRGSRNVDLTVNNSATSNTKLRSTGTILKGNVELSYTDVDAGDFVMIGNPFHSIVNMAGVMTGNTSFTSFITIYDPTLGGQADVNAEANEEESNLGGRGGYVTVNLGTGVPNPASQSNEFLQAYQGMFMQAATDNPSITFKEVDKAPEQSQLDVFSSTATDYITMALYDEDSYTAGSTADDGLVMVFDANSSNAVNQNDAVKFPNPDENLARQEGSSLMSYENRALPQTTDILKLYTTGYVATDYKFVIERIGLSSTPVYLYDNYTGTETLLNQDASTLVSFTIDESIAASTATDRFELRFESTTLSNSTFELQGLSVYPNPTSDILNINLGEQAGRFDQVELFDIQGRLVYSQTLEQNIQQTQVGVNALSSGVYVLNISSSKESYSTKVIVE